MKESPKVRKNKMHKLNFLIFSLSNLLGLEKQSTLDEYLVRKFII
jgi:hypothetical protein